MSNLSNRNPGDIGLAVADGVTLPLSVITSRLGIFGVSGSGKTHTASVIAEEILSVRAHLVVLDPLGVWWGLRAGKTPGGNGVALPIYIFGGEHADVPLHPTTETAQAIADIIAREHISAILDLSEWEPEVQATFATAFAKQLYRLQATLRQPLHCIIDEADIFAPETPGSSAEWECRRAWDTIVRRGRVRGLGVSLISQRPAIVAKNLLTQIGTLIVHRITAAQDRLAVDGWFKSQGSETERKAVLASLASLPMGEAWIWSPSDFSLFERVSIRHRKTFDSSATPQVGQSITSMQSPRPLAALNLAGIRSRLNALLPKEPESSVSKEKNLLTSSSSGKSLRDQTSVRVVEKVVTVDRPVPVLTPEVAEQLKAALTKMDALKEELATLTASITPLLSLLPNSTAGLEEAKVIDNNTTIKVITSVAPAVKEHTALKAITGNIKKSLSNEPVSLQGGAIRILEVLARYPKQRLSHAQIGVLTRLTPSGGTYAKYMAHLRQSGLVKTIENGLLQITPAGMAMLGRHIPPEPHTTTEVLKLWQPALKRREFEILQHLMTIHPRPMTIQEIAATFNLSPAGGAFGAYLGTLRRNGLIVVRQGVASVGITVPNTQ